MQVIGPAQLRQQNDFVWKFLLAKVGLLVKNNFSVGIEPKPVPEKLVEKDHIMLREATFAVFHNKPISYTLEELFRVLTVFK